MVKDIDTSAVDKVVADLKKALSTNVRGVRAGYLANDWGKMPYPESNAPTVADVASWNEFGTERVPPRPFLRTAQNRAFPRAERIVQVRMEENSDIEQIAKDIGLMLASEIKAQITHGTFIPNAPSTIKQKGSSRPLVDTGNMLQSVHWGTTTKSGDKIMD